MPRSSSDAVNESAEAMPDPSHGPVTLARSPNEDARRFIEKTTANRVEVFKATVDPITGEYRDDPYGQIKSLSDHLAADYHGRSLIELIQNGNDAHPSDRSDGEIEVVLADEEPFGTVYVANRGRPFSEKQVDALLRVGKSSKPPGEAIGNKGLGFRSVSHLCDAPEIYSQSGPALARRPLFDGFCFTLEHGSALRGHFDAPRIGRLAECDLPMFSIPRWLTEQPAPVRAFAARGFASVVRLVLRDEGARKEALGQFQVLMSQSAPTLLFMERLCRLTALVEDVEAPTAPDRMVLTRSETRLHGSPLTMSVVNLGDQGAFLLTRRTVQESAMKAAIAVGVATKQLHGSWNEWSGDGEVALAVRVDNGPVVPRLYTFLPMSDGAAAPFHGYLHGSFFPTSSRKAIDSAVELNRLLLEKAATLAASTVRWLAGPTMTERSEEVIDARTAARAVADLLAWAKVSSLDGGLCRWNREATGRPHRLAGYSRPAGCWCGRRVRGCGNCPVSGCHRRPVEQSRADSLVLASGSAVLGGTSRRPLPWRASQITVAASASRQSGPG